MGINVGPGILDLASLLQNAGDNSEALVDKLNEGIILNVSGGEVGQVSESGIGLS